MIIFCEECGERYVIDEEELKGSSMIFICNVCNDIIRIPAPGNVNPKPGEKTNGQADNR